MRLRRALFVTGKIVKMRHGEKTRHAMQALHGVFFRGFFHRAGSPRTIIDHDRLAPTLGELLPHRARHDVRAAAGRDTEYSSVLLVIAY